MRPLTVHVHGRLLADGGRSVLLLLDPEPTEPAAESLFLRFAFVTTGVEEHIFPALLLDDWGRESASAELYQWVYEYGDQFPRAEMFGFDVGGREVQCFLRELEHFARLPCYAYREADAPVAGGVLVEAVLLPDKTAEFPRRERRPSGLQRPLRSVRASWWRVPPALAHFDIKLLDSTES
ncbi:MAG: hypothetical protein ACE5E7_14805 [Anaerolineae bacterium]